MDVMDEGGVGAVAPRGRLLARSSKAERRNEEATDMQRVLTSELRSHVGRRVRLAGWLHHQRRLSRVTFALLRDRAGLAQLVLDEPLELLPETVLEVEGDVVASEQAPSGVEVVSPTFRVLAEPA